MNKKEYKPVAFLDNESSKKAGILKRNTRLWYTVWIGRVPGVYNNWPETKAQVIHFSGNKFKSFLSKKEATKALKDGFEKYIPNL